MRENQNLDNAKRIGSHTQHARPTIGYLTPGITSAYDAALLAGLIEATRERDANLISFPGGLLSTWSDSSFANQRTTLYDLAPGTVDGLVINSTIGNFVTPQELGDFYSRYRSLPVVGLAAAVPGVASVLVDNESGMRDVIIHLIEKHGCRRIAFIRGPEDNDEAERRYHAYTQVLAEYGLPFNPDLVTPGDFLGPAGAAAIRLLMGERQQQPGKDFEAVAASSDAMAIGALAALQERGIRVPDDVAVVGFDDTEEARSVAPPLTTVRQPLFNQGKQAIEKLLTLSGSIQPGKPAPEQMILPTQLVVRRSCGCLDPAVVQAEARATTTGDSRSSVGASLEAALAARRQEILFEMTQAGSHDSALAEQLLDAFSAELKGESPGAFLSTLENSLRQMVKAGGDATAWQGAVSALRQSLPYLDNREISSKAENLWQQARVMIGETAWRAQVQQGLLAERQNQMLQGINQALITTTNVTELMDVLARELPRLGIPSCYLSLYENPRVPTEWSRLILAYEENRRIELEPDGRRFPSPQLTPEGMLTRDRPYSMVVEPLYFREEQIGFVLFEMGPQEGAIYETLRGQISSALQGALILQKHKRGEELLARERNLLRGLIDNVPDYIYVKDTESRFITCNPSLARLIGVATPDELVGKTDFDFYPHELAAKYYADEQMVFQSEQPLLEHEEPVVDGAGNPRWISTTKVPLRDAQGKIFGLVGMGRDITERKQAEAALRYRLELEELVSMISTNFINLTPAETDSAINHVLQTLGTFAGADRSYVFQLSSDGVYINNTHEWCAEGIAPQIQNLQRLTANVPSWWMDKLRRLEIIHIPHVADLPPETSDLKATLEAQNIQSLVAVPIVYRQSLMGYLGFDSVRIEKTWAEEDIASLKTVSEILASSLERERAETERERLLTTLEHRSTQLQTAAEVSRATSSILNLDELLPQAVELIRDRFKLYYVGLFLVGETSQWAILRAGTGAAGQNMLAAGHKLEVGGSSMVGWCIANRQARIALDVGQEAVRFDNPLLPQTRSELALPLISRGQVLGAMTIQSDRPSAFAQEDITILQTMADQVANAIENARLLAERKQAEETMVNERNLLRALIDNVPDRIYAKDTESRFIVCNVAAAHRMGKSSPDELVGKTDFDFVEPELAKQFRADEQAVIQSGQPLINREEPMDSAEGGKRWNLATKVPLLDNQGNIIGIVGLGREITERKLAEAKLERNALQLRTAAEVSRAASSILNLDELLPQVVELIRARFDLYYTGLFLVEDPRPGMDETGQWAVLHAGTGEAGRKMLEAGYRLKVTGDTTIGACIAQGKANIVQDVEEAIRFKNPLLPETRSEMALPLISRGQVIGALTIQSTQPAAFTQEDITILQTLADQLANAVRNARLFTERTRAEEALVQERDLMQALMDNIPDYIYFKDRESRFLRLSKAHAQSFGLSDPAQAVGKTDFDFFTEEHARPAYEDEQRIIQTGQPIMNKEEKETWPDRPDTWALTTKMPLHDKDGRIVGTFGVSRDITYRKKVEADLERLVQDMQARAHREQILRQVTARVRNSTDPDTIVRTAVRELGTALGRPAFIRLGSAEQLAQAKAGGDENKSAAQEGDE